MIRSFVLLATGLLLCGCEECPLVFPVSQTIDLPFALSATQPAGVRSSLPTSLPTSVATAVPASARLVEPEQFFRSTPVARAIAALFSEPVRGNMRIVHGPTSCTPAGGVNPGIRPMWSEPRVGQQLRITWTTRACPFPAPPDDLALLILSLSPYASPVLLAPAGCSLLINPEYVMLPSYSPNAMLRREAGRGIIMLDWTPDSGWVGRSLWSQLLVFAPNENAAGYLMSPALELVIGSAAVN
ncbi:MAG: hypothetical protein ABIP94_17025 [Planctomycetota bacterium]